MMEGRGCRKVLFSFLTVNPRLRSQVEADGEDRRRRMEEGNEPRENQASGGQEETREQQAGEGGTTRLGMEDGDNTDVPATGGPTSDDEAEERSR
jgi:hypothetical protein